MSGNESLQSRARYCAEWSKEPSAARLLRECADRLDDLEAFLKDVSAGKDHPEHGWDGMVRRHAERADRLLGPVFRSRREPSAAPCKTCNGTGRRFPYADAGCTAHNTPCAACGGSGAL